MMLARNGLACSSCPPSSSSCPSISSRPLFLPRLSGGRAPDFTRLEWSSRTSLSRSNARVTCIGDSPREDAARKALEQAFEEKKSVFKKWDEEIKGREVISDGDGGSGSGGGGGWGGSGSGGGDSGGDESWEEAREVFLATTGLILLYLLITMGKGLFTFALYMVRYVLRGFRHIKIPDEPETLDDLGADEAVSDKWGKD